MTSTTIRLYVNRETKNRLLTPVKGNGGFQYLLRAVQAGLSSRSIYLSLSPETAARVIRATKTANGKGGFQGRLAPVAKALTDLKRSLNQR